MTPDEMNEIDARRLARMTHTERANHEKLKAEIIEARLERLQELVDKVRASITRWSFEVPPGLLIGGAHVKAKGNPRRLDLKVTVQLSGGIES